MVWTRKAAVHTNQAKRRIVLCHFMSGNGPGELCRLRSISSTIIYMYIDLFKNMVVTVVQWVSTNYHQTWMMTSTQCTRAQSSVRVTAFISPFPPRTTEAIFTFFIKKKETAVGRGQITRGALRLHDIFVSSSSLTSRWYLIGKGALTKCRKKSDNHHLAITCDACLGVLCLSSQPLSPPPPIIVTNQLSRILSRRHHWHDH